MLSRNVWIINYRVSKNNLRDSSFYLALNTIHQIKNAPNTRFVVKIFAHIKKIQYFCGVMTKKYKNTYFRQ